jgi:hypothetical protein
LAFSCIVLWPQSIIGVGFRYFSTSSFLPFFLLNLKINNWISQIILAFLNASQMASLILRADRQSPMT